MATSHKVLRIGIDVGGTNTDGVILDPSKASEPDKGIVAWHKAPTTTNPSDGIKDALVSMFEQSEVKAEDVACVTIGTTHFVNAVVARDATKLAPVAVIRLCGPFSKHTPPCIDWPDDIKRIVLGHHARVKGGLEVNGNLISDIDEDEIKSECQNIKAKGIKCIVIIGVFSPIDVTYRQEERAANIIEAALPGSHVVLSKEVANLGFLERENAAILNASILPLARKTIRSFQEPMKLLGMQCPVFITQNDGTILTGDAAARLPIRTFSSGPTNSMRGAAYLVQGDTKESLMVVDIGGTTTDVGMLLATGFPRQAAAHSEFAGVRMNFSCPDVKSVGLGGGSIVREDGDSVRIGPDSVGYQIQTKALIFGGDVPTTTDYTVAANSSIAIGDVSRVQHIATEKVQSFSSEVKRMLESVIDTMKTSPDDLPVLLVGGGTIVAPDELEGASRVIKPRYSGVANAIGAAMARVSCVVDTVKSTENGDVKSLLQEVTKDVVQKTIDAGAKKDSVEVVEIETLPLPYISNKSRFIVRAAGDFDLNSVILSQASVPDTNEDHDVDSEAQGVESKSVLQTDDIQSKRPVEHVNIALYRPKVLNRVWYISEADLQWISIGCYILGTGGGGSPYSHMLVMREILRAGGIIRVVNPNDLKDEDLIGCGGGSGSPTVSIEKLQGDEMIEAQNELYGLGLTPKATHIIALEIGGGNGLQGMILGASSNMSIPTVDGDWMGRAYPTKWQTTPVVFAERKTIFCPISMSDGNGNTVVMTKATSDLTVERVFRAGLSQLGSHVGCAEGPVTGAETKRWVVEHTISLSWRIGRAVAKARQSNRIDTVADAIIDEVGGVDSAKVLFRGKIVGVERTLRMGHVYGEVIIEAGDAESTFNGKVKIPFKNENIAALALNDDGTEETMASVPDLISVLDAQNGEAIGTPEYRYGLLVIVLGMTASEKWTSTQRGIDIGGPAGFAMDHIQYKPLGKFVKPLSVIDEFSV
ncbi:hypothetical protein AAFC00_006974 [Neodothiora populina]|uniref:Hydantoinase n=1 Tax=Neodothiora populina TaxID=2781224 RepID=A0ABR3PD12_9PEZI